MVGMTPVSSVVSFVVSLVHILLFSHEIHYIFIYSFDTIAEAYQDIIDIRLDNSTGPLVGSKAFAFSKAWQICNNKRAREFMRMEAS
mgnify:CR=1 FL=1